MQRKMTEPAPPAASTCQLLPHRGVCVYVGVYVLAWMRACCFELISKQQRRKWMLCLCLRLSVCVLVRAPARHCSGCDFVLSLAASHACSSSVFPCASVCVRARARECARSCVPYDCSSSVLLLNMQLTIQALTRRFTGDASACNATCQPPSSPQHPNLTFG